MARPDTATSKTFTPPAMAIEAKHSDAGELMAAAYRIDHLASLLCNTWRGPARDPNGAFHYVDRMLDDGTVVARTGVFTDYLDMTYLRFEMVMDTQVCHPFVMLIEDYRPEPDCATLTGDGATLAMMLATYRDGLTKTATDLFAGRTPTPVGGVADAVLDLLDTVLEGRIPDHALSLSTGQFPNGLAYACVASGHEFSLPTTPILTASALAVIEGSVGPAAAFRVDHNHEGPTYHFDAVRQETTTFRPTSRRRRIGSLERPTSRIGREGLTQEFVAIHHAIAR
ncbi:hypothetical protein [Novosphingobium taihuense]|uniref:Uncharacterized protein n=1 Tax=Novosphingobium taihuense TaxID=260085 RepID=A0A7W7AE71_9SPHN|nr:hypothetical protein [Novosphingobium taihuense]MBB4615400.1 hypothetical protein [Novosphingobium taihuense]TWH82150.1 hypothetical protein IQ25_03302 [Novosphingobium taihuense]